VALPAAGVAAAAAFLDIAAQVCCPPPGGLRYFLVSTLQPIFTRIFIATPPHPPKTPF
jgi:hypothetical protein